MRVLPLRLYICARTIGGYHTTGALRGGENVGALVKASLINLTRANNRVIWQGAAAAYRSARCNARQRAGK